MKPIYLYPNKDNSEIIRLEHYKSNDVKCEIAFKELYIKKLDKSYVLIFRGISEMDNVKFPKDCDQWDYSDTKLYYLTIDSEVKKIWDYKTKTEIDTEPSMIEKGLSVLINNRYIKDDLWCDGYMTFCLNTVLDSLGKGVLSYTEFNSDGRLKKMIDNKIFCVMAKNQDLISNDDIETIVNLVTSGKSSDTKYGKKAGYSLELKFNDVINYLNKCHPEFNGVTLADLAKIGDREDLTPQQVSDIFDTYQIIKELI